MKRILLLVTLLFSLYGKATHIVGGELIYQHLGGSSYYLTIKLYKDCNPGTFNFPNSVQVEAFTGFGLDTLDNFVLPRLGRDTLSPEIDTCAFNPGVCVEEAIYGTIVSLPPVAGGYHLFYQTHARNASILNVVLPLNAGESFYAYVPDNTIYLTNSSPIFSNSPPVFVCQGYDLNLDFSATDADGDSLAYSFYQPYNGRTVGHPSHFDAALYYPTIDLAGTPVDNITFPTITYEAGFSADNPMNAIGGAPLTISTEGVINGIPEAAGQYVIGVMVEEYRDGVKIGEIVRDFQFNVLNCPPPQNALIGDIDGCSGYEIDFINESGDGANGFWWDFGTGDPADTSNLETPTFDYSAYAPGTFTVTLIAQKGTDCADTNTFELILSGVNANFIALDTACSNEPIFFDDLSVSQVNGTLDSWQWDFGDGTSSTLSDPTHGYATGGDYTVRLIVGSDVGCSDTLEKMIHIKEPPGAGISPMMGCIGLDVSFTNTSSAEAEVFHWDFGTGFPADTSNLENPTFTYADYGVYTVTLITQPGTFCADTATLDLMVSNATADFSIPDTTCSNILIDFVDASSVVNGDIFSYEWDFGDGSSSTDSNPSHGYTSEGDFTVTLIVISTIGCSDTISKNIHIVDAPAATIGATDFCSGLTIDFTNTSDVGADGFWWNFGTGVAADTSILENPTFTYPDYGSYTVTLIAQKGTVCQTEATLDIVVSDLTGAIAVPDSACIDTELIFTDLSFTSDSSDITAWNWNFGDLILSDLQNPTHAYGVDGDLTLTFIVYSSVGCSDTITRDIYIQPSPLADAGIDTAMCAGDPSYVLDGSITNATSGIWTGGGGVFLPSETDLNATYFPSLDELVAGYGTLILTTVGNGHCEAQTDTLRINYLGDPEVDAGPDLDVCEDSSFVPITATVGFETNIVWTTEGDGTFDDNEELNTTYTFGTDDLATGSVVIYINTFNFSGCPNDADTLLITINTPPTLNELSDTIICAGFPLFLDPESSTGNGLWSTTGDGTFDPAEGGTTTYSHGTDDETSGTFDISFESTDNGGCEAVSTSLTVEVIPSPTPDFEFEEVCFGSTTNFTNTSTSVDAITTTNWTFEPGITSDLSDVEHDFSAPGTYNVELVIISENGCSDTIIKPVRSHFIPVTNFEVPKPCLNGGTFFFDATSVDSAQVTSWLWDFGDNSNTDTTQNPVHQYGSEGVYDISLSVSSEFGCKHDTTISVLINLGPLAAFNANPNSANLYVDVNFTDQTVENGAPLDSWAWDFADGTSAFEQNPTHQFDLEDEYNVELIVTDQNGCIDTAYKIIPIYHGPVVPSGFSPNGDGSNDWLSILGGNFESIDFKVYNNWGEVIFETVDVDSPGWDGTFKGEPQPLGVYVYLAKVKTFDGVEHILSGDVSLIR